jgi:hypothetical protein
VVDAWNYPGWNAQTRQPLTDPAGNVNYTLPADVKTVNLTGNFLVPPSTLTKGYCIVQSNEELFYSTTTEYLGALKFFAAIRNGVFKLSVPATDNTNLSPTGWNYKVNVVIGGKEIMDIDCLIPYGTGADISVFNLTPITPPS